MAVWSSTREGRLTSHVLNSFSIGKWRKYTVLETVSLSLKLQGSFTVSLKHHVLSKGQVKTKILEEQTILSAGAKGIYF